MRDMYPQAVVKVMEGMPSVLVTQFAYNRQQGGGTELVNYSGSFALKFHGICKIKVVNGFHDCECGNRLHGVADSDELKEFLVKQGEPIDTKLYFSEFDYTELNIGDRFKIEGAIRQADDIRAQLG